MYNSSLNTSDKSRHSFSWFLEDPIFPQGPLVNLLKSPLEKISMTAVACKWGIADSKAEMAMPLAKHVYLLRLNDLH